MDPAKVQDILHTSAPTTAKALSRFVGQIWWHGRMLRYLADFATPLHAALHMVPFRWMKGEDTVYESLKVMLSQVPVVQPPIWTQQIDHIFTDASDIAIGSALMQRTPPNWFRPIFYASRRLSHAVKTYFTTEKEAHNMIYNITKFRHYLLGRKFTFDVDHSTLFYLFDKQALTGLLARWM